MSDDYKQDSCSMTPPLSPIHKAPEQMDYEFAIDTVEKRQFEEDFLSDVPACFTCCGETNPRDFKDVHRDGYLKQQTLHRMLSCNDLAPTAFQTVTAELFGYQFITQLALKEDIHRVFFMLRKHINQFERRVQETASTCNGGECATEFMQYRQDILTFFEYIKTYIYRFVPKNSTQEFSSVLTNQLHALLLHVGRLTSLPGHIIENSASRHGSNTSSGNYHILHFFMDVHWNVVQILYLLSTNLSEVTYGEPVLLCSRIDAIEMDVFSQAVLILIWDLVIIALNRHHKLSFSVYKQTSPFPCTCIRELWTLVLQLLDHRHDQHGKESFWVVLQHVLQEILHPSLQEQKHDTSQFQLPPDFNCKNPVGFCWWLLSNLAPLYGYNMKGEYNISNVSNMRSNYVVVHGLLKSSLSTNEGRYDENSTRCYLRCCLELSYLWEADMEILNTLWDHYYKRLNEGFHTPGHVVEGLARLSSSAIGWVEQCRSRCEDRIEGNRNENSFELFLRLLGLHLAKVLKDGRRQEWKQMKGRFYSRFHQRRMLELTEMGLMNFTSLFLTLALIGDMDDVASRLFDLYSMLNFENLDQSRRCVLWRGVFALLIILQENSELPNNFTEKIVSSFSGVCREFAKQSNHTRKHQLWSLITIYIEGTQDVFENAAGITTTHAKLIGPGFKDLLQACNQNELRVMLTFIQMILTRHRILYKMLSRIASSNPVLLQQQTLLSNSMWLHIFPFIKEHVTTQTPPCSLADVAASFTLLAQDLPPGAGSSAKEEFVSIFKLFSLGPKVNPSISCRYLSHMLANDAVMNRLVAEIPEYEVYLIQAWFRCCLLSSDTTSHDQMQELTRLILKLPKLIDIFSSASLEPAEQYDIVVIQFLKVTGKQYCSTEGWLKKIHFRDETVKYFGNVPAFLLPVLKHGSPDAVKVIYNITGHMVKYCAHLLYVKSKPDSILMPLYNMLINPSKVQTQYMTNALKSYLHLFVQGLGSLDYQKDPYIRETLSTVVTCYLGKFPLNMQAVGTAVAVHPILVAVAPSCAKTFGEEAISLRHFIIEKVIEKFLSFKGASVSSTASLGLSFLSALYQRTMSPKAVYSDVPMLLPTVLNYCLVCENDAHRGEVLYLLQCLVEACKKQLDTSNSDALTKILQNFVQQQFMVYVSKVFLILEKVAVLYSEAVKSIIPTCNQVVEEAEIKRGVGIDTKLRQALSSLSKTCDFEQDI